MTFRRLFRHHRVRRYGMRLIVLLLAAGIVAGVIAWLSGEGEVQEPRPTPTVGSFFPATDTPSPTSGAVLATAGPGGFDATPPPMAGLLPAPDPRLLEPAIMLDVVDGDTIDVRVRGGEERVRLFGVDTTERGEPCFREASARIQELAGDRVLLLPDLRNRDGFERLLRYVFTEDGRSIDAMLIAEGLGYAWREDGQYREELIAIEEQAMAAKAGCLW